MDASPDYTGRLKDVSSRFPASSCHGSFEQPRCTHDSAEVSKQAQLHKTTAIVRLAVALKACSSPEFVVHDFSKPFATQKDCSRLSFGLLCKKTRPRSSCTRQGSEGKGLTDESPGQLFYLRSVRCIVTVTMCLSFLSRGLIDVAAVSH